MFKEYIVKLKGHVGEDRTNFILANALFFVVLGSNDISNTYFLSHLRELQYDVPTYSDFMLNLASNFFKVCIKFHNFFNCTTIYDFNFNEQSALCYYK